jgi:CubicO group peptidase (beta-lactamase class C family)
MHKQATISLVIYSFAMLFNSHCILAQQHEKSMNNKHAQLKSETYNYLTNEIKTRKIVGLSAAVVLNNEVVIAEGFGYSDKQRLKQAKSNTLFPVASITKVFTGIAVMQLVDQGKLNLNSPISEYIPELKLPGGEEEVITTQMLLTHHSGIQGDIMYNWLLPETASDSSAYLQIVELINQAGVVFKPGKMFSYSNAAYTLLGVLIHNVSGKPYPKYIREHILEACEMNEAICYANENANLDISLGYDGNKVLSMPKKLGTPAGGMALTATDAAKFIQEIVACYHGNGKLLKKESLRYMMTTMNSNNKIDHGFTIGLTWFLHHPLSKQTTYAAHRGELPPFHAILIILPDLKTGVFIASNTNKAGYAPDELAHHIAESISKSIKYEAQTDNTLTFQSNFEAAKFTQFEGYYPNVYFGPMHLQVKDKKLLLQTYAMPLPMHLIPSDKGNFNIKIKLFDIMPIPIKTLSNIHVELDSVNGNNYLYFNIMNTLINPNLQIEVKPIPSNFNAYVGKYQVVNMEKPDRVVKHIKIVRNKDFLIMKYTFLGRHKFNLALLPINKNTARIAGEGQFLGETIHWENNNDQVKMYWSGLVLEKQ